MNVEAIGIESVDARDPCIEHLLDAIRLDRLDLGDETLAVRLAPVTRQKTLKTQRLVVVGKAYPFGEQSNALPGNRQFMLCRAVVEAQRALSVGHRSLPCRPTVAVDRGGYAKAQQHALHGFQRTEIVLAQANADALRLCALHRSIAVEQAAQQAAMEVGRGPLHCRREFLVSRSQSEIDGERLDRGERQPPFVADLHLDPTAEVGAVREGSCGRKGGFHHAIHAEARRLPVGSLRWLPDADDRFVLLERAITHQQTQEISFRPGTAAGPLRGRTMIVQGDPVARLQLAGRDPFGLLRPAREALDPSHAMIGRQSKAIAFPRP
jgi:hypothetical protein